MKFWMFRTNLRSLESYHSIQDIETFKKECHDFYLLQLIWYLENNYINEAIVWRLRPKDEHKTIQNKHWKVNGKWFSQCWVDKFDEALEQNSLSADISFFRGGFLEYDKLTQHKQSWKLGTKLYLGAGQRTYPKYGGKYDRFLFEEEISFGKNNIPFYKTTNNNIFYPQSPMESSLYDICYISNFSQLRYKGQEEFIKQISKSKFLQSLRIIHLGNKPEIGTMLCHQHNVNNIEFKGWVDKPEVNNILNQSKFGLVYSNDIDGCPRVITEILSSGTPLFIYHKTKLLKYYKQYGVLTFNNENIELVIQTGIQSFLIKEKILENINNTSMDKICKLNWEQWML